MAGYGYYSEAEGCEVRGMYEYPFMVRAQPRPLGIFDRPEWVSLRSHRTQAAADAWLAANEAEYRKGKNGFVAFRVENWNE